MLLCVGVVNMYMLQVKNHPHIEAHDWNVYVGQLMMYARVATLKR